MSLLQLKISVISKGTLPCNAWCVCNKEFAVYEWILFLESICLGLRVDPYTTNTFWKRTSQKNWNYSRHNKFMWIIFIHQTLYLTLFFSTKKAAKSWCHSNGVSVFIQLNQCYRYYYLNCVILSIFCSFEVYKSHCGCTIYNFNSRELEPHCNEDCWTRHSYLITSNIEIYWVFQKKNTVQWNRVCLVCTLLYFYPSLSLSTARLASFIKASDRFNISHLFM